MAAAASRLVPRRWLARSAASARLRLALLFSGMFLLLGTAVIVIIFVAVESGAAVNQTTSQAAPVGVTGGPAVHAAVTQQHSADVARLLAVSWLTLAVTAAASAVLGWFAAGRVLSPLRRMADTARTISAGNLHQRLAVDGPDDEFKQLGDTFDELLARLEASFASQQRFVANAAHELRTPLTLERTLVQVALADPDASATTLRGTCEELVASGRAHERLLDALLTLATSERGLQQRSPIDLAAVVGNALERTAVGIELRKLELRADLGPAKILGDPALIERLVANLIDNALQHNRPGGMLEVETATESAYATLSVVNDGPSIPPDEIERLLEPFQRLERDRTGPGDAHGLGLSIVRAIATAHGAELNADPRANGGLVVTVSFPAVTPP